jgi:uncharacterized protein
LADAIVPCAEPDMPQFPLLHHMVFTNAHPHSELAECVSLLLAAGVDINATFPEKSVDFTALLCVAGCTCCSAVVDVLLRAGADPCVATSRGGKTALHRAAVAGLPATCELLVSKAAAALEISDSAGQTALFHAVNDGRLDTVKCLLRCGADVNTTDHQRTTPLIAACIKGRESIVRCLLEAGADVNAAEGAGRTAFMAAVQTDSKPLIQLLLDHNANISARDSSGYNALVIAVHEGYISMMDFLVQKGLAVTTVDHHGLTLLMMAVLDKRLAAVEWLPQHLQ